MLPLKFAITSCLSLCFATPSLAGAAVSRAAVAKHLTWVAFLQCKVQVGILAVVCTHIRHQLAFADCLAWLGHYAL
jgi:hypothetical protein